MANRVTGLGAVGGKSSCTMPNFRLTKFGLYQKAQGSRPQQYSILIRTRQADLMTSWETCVCRTVRSGVSSTNNWKGSTIHASSKFSISVMIFEASLAVSSIWVWVLIAMQIAHERGGRKRRKAMT